MIFIDTNIAIAMRDAEPLTLRLVSDLDQRPVLSMITRIELKNGAHRAASTHRRRSLKEMLVSLRTIMFEEADILTYGSIVADLGFDRRLTLDRLIAAQAIARDATLISRNGRDFRKIKGLRLIEWEASP